MKVVGIIYPNNKVSKMATLRLLRKRKINIAKVTWVAEVESGELIKDLKTLGNEVIEFSSGTNTDEIESLEDGFLELYELFKGLASDPYTFDLETELGNRNMKTIDKAKEICLKDFFIILNFMVGLKK